MVSVNLLAAWDLLERDVEGGLMEMCLNPECVCGGVHICWLMERGAHAFGWVWERCGAPPCCAGHGLDDMPSASGGCTLVRVGVPGVHVDKIGT